MSRRRRAGQPAYGQRPQADLQQVEGAKPRPYVTIVLPCYNEGEHVLREIDRITAAMDASEFTYELLCIDDASTDNTLEVLHDAAARYAHIRVMPFRRNGGSAAPPAGSAPSRPTARSSCGPTPT